VQTQGGVPRNRAAKHLVRLLLGIVLGIRVLERSKTEQALLEGVARQALAHCIERLPSRFDDEPVECCEISPFTVRVCNRVNQSPG